MNLVATREALTESKRSGKDRVVAATDGEGRPSNVVRDDAEIVEFAQKGVIEPFAQDIHRVDGGALPRPSIRLPGRAVRVFELCAVQGFGDEGDVRTLVPHHGQPCLRVARGRSAAIASTKASAADADADASVLV